MSERDQMKAALEQFFVPQLMGAGFTGSLPHFRAVRRDRIELLSVVFDKWGGAFALEISYAMTNRADDNRTEAFRRVPSHELTVHHTEKRLRLPEKGDWIRFCDTVTIQGENGLMIYSLSDQQKDAFLSKLPPGSYRIEEADADACHKAAVAAVQLLRQARIWWSQQPRSTPPEARHNRRPAPKRSFWQRLLHRREK